jgi:hypothetical protein
MAETGRAVAGVAGRMAVVRRVGRGRLYSLRQDRTNLSDRWYCEKSALLPGQSVRKGGEVGQSESRRGTREEGKKKKKHIENRSPLFSSYECNWSLDMSAKLQELVCCAQVASMALTLACPTLHLPTSLKESKILLRREKRDRWIC